METSFPKAENRFLKASDFQDNLTTLTFKGWEKKANKDDPERNKTWKDQLKYQLSYSYPEWAIDPVTGEKRVGRDGQPFQNKNWNPDYPQGYSIRYIFDEGTLETGSLPLFTKFCVLQPKQGESIDMVRRGEGKETTWVITRSGQSQVVDNQSHPTDESIVPF